MRYLMDREVVVFWFRRDLRLDDNRGLFAALNSGKLVLPLFIFDEEITQKLPKNDARISFIYQTLSDLDGELKRMGSSLLVKQGKPMEVWKDLVATFSIASVYFNEDYEPYARKRDADLQLFLKSVNIQAHAYKDQVIFEKEEVVKKGGLPYTVFTPYKKKWLQTLNKEKDLTFFKVKECYFYKHQLRFPLLHELGFEVSTIKVKPYNLSNLKVYDSYRDFPGEDTTSYLSPYLRFGLVSIRKMVSLALVTNAVFLSELIWREFFMQIIYHFPQVVTQNFKRKYDGIQWRNNEEEFKKWCAGTTGYPMVDAGMRALNETGYMHNRVRMITAGFLCKHLLIDWRWGEAYFAQKLLDYDMSANNGNWQWASGTGCDAAPYFRIFNPSEQLKKFDKNLVYIKKWIQDFEELSYPMPMVVHKFARERAIETYKQGLL
ncbi:deoxyribodipyrimidine photo-lyase [Tenacibaculum maritimum]